MPLPLFLPCAAGVEALLEAEVRALLPDADVRAARGGVALAGDPLEVMVLNLESRLAQRVLIEVAEGPYRDEQRPLRARPRRRLVDWITPRQTLACRQHRAAQSAAQPQLRRPAHQGRGLRPDARRARPAAERRHRAPRSARRAARRRRTRRGLRRQLGRVALQARLARGPGRRAAEGDARRGDARRRRLARRGRARRRACTTRAAARGRSRSKPRRSPCGIAPGRLRRFAFERLLPFAGAERRADWQRLKTKARSPRARARGADLRQRHLVSHGRLRAPQRRARRRRRRRSTSTAATRSNGRRRHCRRSCPAR